MVAFRGLRTDLTQWLSIVTTISYLAALFLVIILLVGERPLIIDLVMDRVFSTGTIVTLACFSALLLSA